MRASQADCAYSQFAPQKSTPVALTVGACVRSAASKLASLGYETLVLPSSSPAYTLPYAEKLRGWQTLRRFLSPRSAAR